MQIYENEIDEYLKDVDHVASEIKYYETKTHLTMEKEMHILQKMQLLEQQIAQNFSYLGNYEKSNTVILYHFFNDFNTIRSFLRSDQNLFQEKCGNQRLHHF